ncbi:metallophosphoesterase [Saccharopolyspora halophila]|uniref:metallophosphoesterase family protein n=1 Tax=Saccharopolyspora halophila TaxID=405551 RepID=UPI0031E16329
MAAPQAPVGNLLAISDLHISYAENRDIAAELEPESESDWLIIAGDVSEIVEDFEQILRLLAERFAKVIWVPGNHELWTHPQDAVQLRGEHRYRELVGICRRLGVLTPEDPYPLWTGEGGPAWIVPMFVGYDYSFYPPGARNKTEGLEIAYASGVVCSDEFLLHPDPHPSREDWCSARIAETERRLSELDDAYPTVLINHYPLVREPTDVLRYPEFAQWCGTQRTADWHRRFRASCVVYGHLHIPRITHHDGVPFHEVSLGYPREWRKHGHRHGLLRTVLPSGTTARLRRRRTAATTALAAGSARALRLTHHHPCGVAPAESALADRNAHSGAVLHALLHLRRDESPAASFTSFRWLPS